MQKINKILILVCIIGMISTSYLTYSKFFNPAICNIGSSFSCSLVNTSPYSEIFRIPLSILGFLYFLLIIILVLKDKLDLIFYISIPVIIYSLYLTYVEVIIIKTLCIVCEFTKILIFIILGVTTFKKN